MHCVAGGYNLGSVADIRDGKVLYGSGPNVLESGQVIYAAPANISYVRYASLSNEKYVLAASVNGSIAVVSRDKCTTTCIGSAVSAIDFLDDQSNLAMLIVASGVAQGCLCAWSFSQDRELRPIPISLDYSPRKVTALHLMRHSDKHLLLYVATTDNLLHAYSLSDDGAMSINDHVVLDGHLNWIVSIASCGPLLATASLDRTIRTWSLSLDGAGGLLDELVPKKRHLVSNGSRLGIIQSALLVGHEAAVHHVHFTDSGLLVSASADRSTIIWSDGEAKVQVGDTSGGQLGASVGADHSTGFYWANVSADAAAHYGVLHAGQSGGSIQRWQSTDANGSSAPLSPITGHFGSVECIDWLADDIILSSGHDQTTRAWRLLPNRQACSSSQSQQLVEISRLQIHGYDIHGIAVCGKDEFASVADEKVIRIFRAPADWSERLRCIDAGEQFMLGCTTTSVPALGLTNKTFEGDGSGNQQLSYAIPVESELARSTLWPETAKLYGHGREVYRVAFNHQKDDPLLATACKATRPEDAAIRLWRGDRQAAVLSGPTLTVTCLSFCNGYLLATSRDRRAYVYRGDQLVASVEAHVRVIWAAAWHASSSFVTVSRDRHIKYWRMSDDHQVECVQDIEAESSLTSVAIAADLMVVGTEEGCLLSYLFDSKAWTLRRKRSLCAGQINNLKFRNGLLAAASIDHSLHVLSVDEELLL